MINNSRIFSIEKLLEEYEKTSYITYKKAKYTIEDIDVEAGTLRDYLKSIEPLLPNMFDAWHQLIFDNCESWLKGSLDEWVRDDYHYSEENIEAARKHYLQCFNKKDLPGLVDFKFGNQFNTGRSVDTEFTIFIMDTDWGVWDPAAKKTKDTKLTIGSVEHNIAFETTYLMPRIFGLDYKISTMGFSKDGKKIIDTMIED